MATQLRQPALLPDLAEALVRSADELWLARTAETLWPVAHAYFLRADEAWRANALDEVIERARQGLQRVEAAGAVGLLFVFQTLVIEALLVQGNWDDAVAEATTAISLVTDYGGDSQRVPPMGMLAWIAFHRGDLDSAQQLIDETAGQPGPFYEGPWRGWTEALLAEARGDLDAACRLMRPLGFRLARPHAMRVAVLSGQRDAAEEIAAAAECLTGERDRPIKIRCRAWLDLDAELMMEAAEIYESEMPFTERASALEDVASLLLHLGRSGDAKPWLLRALQRWDTLGATTRVERITSELRKLGVRRPPPRRRPRPDFGWESLTDTERKVVELVATGLSNPEVAARLFVARRTVTTHLSSAFRKLGVTRRAELAAMVARRSTEA